MNTKLCLLDYNSCIAKYYSITIFELIANTSLYGSIYSHKSLCNYLLSICSTIHQSIKFEQLIELDIVRLQHKSMIHGVIILI